LHKIFGPGEKGGCSGPRCAVALAGRKNEKKSGIADGLQENMGQNRKLGSRNRIQILIHGFWFKSNSFKHFQTNFELDFKIG
jgi:hypothetical protein